MFNIRDYRYTSPNIPPRSSRYAIKERSWWIFIAGTVAAGIAAIFLSGGDDEKEQPVTKPAPSAVQIPDKNFVNEELDPIASGPELETESKTETPKKFSAIIKPAEGVKVTVSERRIVEALKIINDKSEADIVKEEVRKRTKNNLEQMIRDLKTQGIDAKLRTDKDKAPDKMSADFYFQWRYTGEKDYREIRSTTVKSTANSR